MTNSEHALIAFLGLGAMGTRMASRLLAAGHRVRVWNRSPDAAAPLVSAGAEAAASLSAACREATAIITMVRDDEASRSVWLGEGGALAAAPAGAVAIECSTLTPRWTEELAAQAAARSVRFVASPVLGSRPQAEAGQLIALLGGEADDIAQAQLVSDAFVGKFFRMGDAPQAASAKLAVNGFFATQLAAAGEMIAYMRSIGIEDDVWQRLFSDIPVVAPGIAGAMKGMASNAFDPMFPIDLVHKDLACFIKSAEQQSAGSEVVGFVQQLYERAIKAGYGGENITAIQRVFQ